MRIFASAFLFAHGTCSFLLSVVRLATAVAFWVGVASGSGGLCSDRARAGAQSVAGARHDPGTGVDRRTGKGWAMREPRQTEDRLIKLAAENLAAVITETRPHSDELRELLETEMRKLVDDIESADATRAPSASGGGASGFG
jgi:hypothetical protein